MENRVSKEMKRFNHLISEIEATYHEIFWKLKLSDSAIQVLYTICNDGQDCLLQDICYHTGLSKQTINSAVRKLEAEHAVYLEPVGSKSKKVCLTESGKQLADQTAGRVIRAENEIFASWPAEDVQKYLDLTEAYLLALRRKTTEF